MAAESDIAVLENPGREANAASSDEVVVKVQGLN